MSKVRSSYSDKGKILTIKISGNFCLPLLDSFSKIYLNHKPVPENYVVDFAKLEHLDSSGIGMLIELRNFVAQRKSNDDEDGKKISIVNCPENVKSLLMQSKLDELFIIE